MNDLACAEEGIRSIQSAATQDEHQAHPPFPSQVEAKDSGSRQPQDDKVGHNGESGKAIPKCALVDAYLVGACPPGVLGQPTLEHCNNQTTDAENQEEPNDHLGKVAECGLKKDAEIGDKDREFGSAQADSIKQLTHEEQLQHLDQTRCLEIEPQGLRLTFTPFISSSWLALPLSMPNP